jgi:DNA modification methylase
MSFLDKLFLKDARLLTEILPPTEPCVDVIITSPPYWNLKDYGASNQIGHGQTKDQYLADIKEILRNCLLVTKPTGSLWLVVDTYRKDGELQLLPLELAECARQVGWKMRELIVWDKQHSVPWQTKRQLRHTSEFILFMTKSDDYKYYMERIKTLDEISKWWADFPERFNPKGKTPTNIWSIPIRPRGTWRKPSKNNHYCSFPTTLVARIIELTTDLGDLVMDPFAGSGVVLAQAAAMGRHYIGFEISERYEQAFEAIMDEVAAEWEEMKVWRKSEADAKIDFEQTILKLRALKYARQVTKPLSETLRKEQLAEVQVVLCVASIPNEYQRGRPFGIKIFIVANRILSEFGKALEAVRAQAARPPLTQYGIRSDICITTYSDLQQRTELIDQTLYLYPGYKPRKYIASGSLKTWFEEGQLKELADSLKVPMLANIAVDVAWVLEG